MLVRSAAFWATTLGAMLLVVTVSSAHALTMKECSAKYKAAQDSGTLKGMKWNDFRKAECGTGASALPTSAPAAAPAAVEDVEVVAAAGSVAGWSEVLDKLNRTVRAVYRDAQPELSGSTLVLWFRYEFHHKKAQEQSAQLLPLVRDWLGKGVTVDFRLKELGGEGMKVGPRTPASPEDDPFVREVVRRFDGRVTRVKEVSE